MTKFSVICLVAALANSAFAGVTVTRPSDGATVQSPVHFVATATTNCAKGVASMGIYTAPYVLAYVTAGASLDTKLTLDAGTYHAVVEEWDYCGGVDTEPITIKVTNQPGVYVSSPANNSKVNSPVNFVATATTSCSKGVAAMGIYTAPYQLAYKVNGAQLNTKLSLSPGTYNTTVVEWDNCGGGTGAPVNITVTSGGNTFYNVHAGGGWTGYGELPPTYDICNWCSPGGPEVTWSMYQGIKSPSQSGNSTQYNIGGSTPYADVLWNNHLIGDLSSQGMPDSNHTQVPTLHNFTYDVYFYGANLELSQALEFDINQFFNGMGFIWGTECRIAGGHQWDIWDNINQRWVTTGVACKPVSNNWNHLILQVQRTQDNRLLYQSITLNGSTATLNQYYSPGSAPGGWWGITINYQMDGNYAQQSHSVYLDQLNFTYW